MIKYNSLGQPLEIYQAESELGGSLNWDTLDAYSYGVKRLDLNYNSQSGNLESVQKSSDFESIYIWGYNDTQPVIKAENITEAALNSAVTSAVSAVPGSYNDLEDLLEGVGDMSLLAQRDTWESFNNSLRAHTNLSSSLVTT